MATDYVRTYSYALATTEKTELKETIEPEVNANSGQSGFELLIKGQDTLLRLISAIQATERSLDIQYYIIQNDLSGKLLLETILRAADRKVRVRILMDDLNVHSSDPTWMLLNAHPNIEIRIFNPFATLDETLLVRIINIFARINHFNKRMHNKIMIADNQLAITGGRNLGDSYFDVSSDFNFRDIDVLVIGHVVPKLSESFDKYWNDDESFPITAILKKSNNPEAIIKLREEMQLHWHEQMEKDTVISQIPLTVQLKNGQIPLIWASAELAVDSPSKIDSPKESVVSKPAVHLNKMAENAKQEFIIISPYFVPGEKGTQALQELAQQGAKVRILTNSLASIDAVAAHVGYRRYRQALVAAGIELYEMKPIRGKRPHSRRFSSSSRNSLHSKVYIADRHDVMIGSFNLDPRSVNLNTEMALVIHSPLLAAQVVAMFEKAILPTTSFHVTMNNATLEWISKKDGKEKRYQSEPEAGFWRKIKVNLLSILPFEDQL